MSFVITHPPRTEAAIVHGFAGIGTATVHEAQDRSGLLLPYMRPIYSGALITGTAVTVSVAPGDNWMLHVAVEQCQAGDILVVAPTSHSEQGYFGELLACSLMARGVRGLIIEAGCRDVAALTELGFPVWSRAISAQGTVKETLGSVNIPLVCAGQRIAPGDLLVADDDGVVVVQRSIARTVLDKSLARERKEEETRKRLKAGELGLDIYGMRQKLADKGLVYRPWQEGVE